MADIRGIDILDVISDSDSNGPYQASIQDLCRRLTRKCERLKDDKNALVAQHHRHVTQVRQENNELLEQLRHENNELLEQNRNLKEKYESLKGEYTVITKKCEEYKKKCLHMCKKHPKVKTEIIVPPQKLERKTFQKLGYKYRTHH